MSGPYSTQKLVHHPEALEAMRQGRGQPPTQIHFMPALACNQHCTFCSYGHRLEHDGPEQLKWKNMELMSDAFMPLAKMRECVADWKEMGVKAIELTGGGEPLIYPYVDEFFDLVAQWGVDLALVTNGTALTTDRLSRFRNTNWKWARVSIDAGTQTSYAMTRRVPPIHWLKAWAAVRELARAKTRPDQRVGVGYVVDTHNYNGIYEAAELAVDHGADNMRIALAFTPQNLARFPTGAVEGAIGQAAQAKVDFGKHVQINDLVAERRDNIELQGQDYKFCAVKEVLCVVGGDQNVYTCCTLAFNSKGLIGSIKDQSFKQMWWLEQTFFRDHDARKICNMPCLYEKRNKVALELIKLTRFETDLIAAEDKLAIHKNFI